MNPAEQTSPAFLTWRVLQQFVPQAHVGLFRGGATGRGSPIAHFTSGEHLEVSPQAAGSVQRFLKNAAVFAQDNQTSIRADDSSRAAVAGIRLDWSIVAEDLQSALPNSDRRDIITILSFVSEVANRRYEHAGAQTAIAYEPESRIEQNYGRLGHYLLSAYKALLVLVRDGHTVLRVGRDCVIQGLELLGRREISPVDESDSPVPPQFLSLAQLTKNGLPPDNSESTMEVKTKPLANNRAVFVVSSDGSIEILTNGAVRFRRVNNVWRFVCLEAAHDAIRSQVRKCQSDEKVECIARNILILALDLAIRRRGALLFLCKEPTTDVLQHFLLHDGVILGSNNYPFEALTVRSRFTQMIGSQRLTLRKLHDSRVASLLRDVSSIDGATVFSYRGRLLGFGCIVKIDSPDTDPRAHVREGASTTAARHISRAGPTLRVSSDGDITLYLDGREWGYVF